MAKDFYQKPEEKEEVRFLLIFFGWGRISLMRLELSAILDNLAAET
jgi:hypothetical protein